MMKNYKRAFMVAFGLLFLSTITRAQATYSVTFNVDMTGVDVTQGVWITGTFDEFDPVNTDLAMTDDDSDGIYTITVTVDDGYTRWNFFNAKNWANNGQVPEGCQADGQTYKQYGHTFTGNTTLFYEFGECAKSEWDGVSWAPQTPQDRGHLIFSENYNEVGDLTSGVIEIADGKTVTIPSGSTLTINGTANINQEAVTPAPILSEDMEDGQVPSAFVLGTVAATVEDNPSNMGTKALALVNNSGVADYAYYDFTIATGGDYTVSLRRIANGWHQIQVHTDAGTNLGNLWQGSDPAVKDLSGSYTLTAGSYRIRFWPANAGGALNVDNIVVQGAASVATGNLVIESGASLITDSNFDKEVTIKRNTSFADRRYSFVGSPVVQDPSITGASLGSDVYWYDETVGYDADAGLSRWKDASAAELVPGKGYTQAGQAALSFTGVPNSGTVNVFGLTKTTTGTANASDQGWHLVSNPYAASIDVAAFLAANVGEGGAVSIWEDGGSDAGRRTNADYITANAIATVNGAAKDFEGYIGSAQGFFVKATVDNSEIIFTEDMRVAGNNADANYFRKGESKKLGIKLSLSNADQSATNELFVGLIEGATTGVDRVYDASKLIGNQDLQFYSLIEDMRYAIQGLPVKEGVSTELAFNLGVAGELTLNVEELNLGDDGLSFYLYDAVTQQTYDLSEVQTVTFSSFAGADQNRFKLTYGAARVLANNKLAAQPLYRYLNNMLIVDFGHVLNVGEVAVYDMSGKVLVQSKLSNQSLGNLEIPIFTKGINIVKISTSEGVFTRKFIF
ncbi:MAG: T9SS type A sorting domain-containing protein [Cyclobacteriaceae bacterium]